MSAILDTLLKAEFPLADEQWTRLRGLVVETARRRLVGRRFLDVFGPLGAGVQSVPVDELGGQEPADMAIVEGEPEARVEPRTRRTLPLPVLYKDFVLSWRDLQAAASGCLPLDLSAASGAAALVADREDQAIFSGVPALGVPGLLTVEGRQRVPRGDWEKPGAGLEAVAAAIEKLIAAGARGPFTMVAAPRLYNRLTRVLDRTGHSELAHVVELLGDGAYRSPALPGDGAVVLAVGAQFFDLAVAQDLEVAYLGAEGMNHPFRVFESVVLRIKRPEAICALE